MRRPRLVMGEGSQMTTEHPQSDDESRSYEELRARLRNRPTSLDPVAQRLRREVHRVREC